MERGRMCLLFFASLVSLLATGVDCQKYYGAPMGRLSELQHQVKGEVFAVDSRTLHIKGFSYDGTAPDAFFYAGTSGKPSDRGFIIPDENGGTEPLGGYRNKDVTITLPEGKTLKDIKWFSIWCRAFAIDFGNVMISNSLDYPRPQKIDALPSLEHGVSSDRIVVVDAQTFLIPNFSYDGEAPDGHFWVGKGSSVGPSGTVVPDENGSEEPLKRYNRKTIVITLPGSLTVFDIDFLSIWCKAFNADFGHVKIPKNLNVPPSLKMLGVAPQSNGYSYQPPSSSRPSLSYQPQTSSRKSSRPKYTPTTRRPKYNRPTTKRPSYEPSSIESRPSSSRSHSSSPFSSRPSKSQSSRPFGSSAFSSGRRTHDRSSEEQESGSRSRHFGGKSSESREDSSESIFANHEIQFPTNRFSAFPSRSSSESSESRFGHSRSSSSRSSPSRSSPSRSSPSRSSLSRSSSSRSSSSRSSSSRPSSHSQERSNFRFPSSPSAPAPRPPPRASRPPSPSSSRSSKGSTGQDGRPSPISSYNFSNGGSTSHFNIYG